MSVAVAGGGGGEEDGGDGEVHGREVGYRVAGLYVARSAAASPNALPLPPLYHLVRPLCMRIVVASVAQLLYGLELCRLGWLADISFAIAMRPSNARAGFQGTW